MKMSLAPLPVCLTWSAHQKNKNIAYMITKTYQELSQHDRLPDSPTR